LFAAGDRRNCVKILRDFALVKERLLTVPATAIGANILNEVRQSAAAARAGGGRLRPVKSTAAR
jgi:hypothetical protein